MTSVKEINDLVALCGAAAERALRAKLAMPPPPGDAAGAALWDAQRTRLTNQIDSLGTIILKLTTGAIMHALHSASADLASLGAATARARRSIEQIDEIGALLTKVAAVLAVATAVLTVAGAPSPASIAALATAIDQL